MTGPRSPKQFAYDLLSIAKLRRSGVPFPPVAEAGSSPSLFIGPANSAGQGTAWARAAERSTAGSPAPISATSMVFARDDRFAFDIDQPVPSGYGAHSRAWQRRQLAGVRGYDAVIVESGQPLFAGLLDGDPLRQMRALEQAGARVALLFHGSDIRDPDRHIAAEPHSHFAVDEAFTAPLRGVTARNREFVRESGATVFVSTPDLLDEVPGAVWLPVVVEPDRWAGAPDPFAAGGTLRTVHVPSSSLVKGTELVDPLLRRLDGEGAIRHRSVTGLPHAEMPAAYGSADVVIDQFRVGNYGVAACEAMAAGRLVVSHVSDRVRQLTRELTGEDLPIVEATPETLEAVLTDISERPEHYAGTAARGARFVREHHDGRRSGRVLAEWMGLAGRGAGEASENEEGR